MMSATVYVIVLVFCHEISGGIYKPAFPDDVFTGPELQIESKVLSNGFGLWTITTTPGNRIRLYCQMTAELNCSTEAIMVSPEGDPDLMGALTYCSVGKYVRVFSKQHFMTVGFITLDTPGYRTEKFYCRKTKAIPIQNQLCNCGNQEAGEAMMAALYQKTENKYQGSVFNMICASTIIDNRHVLTTALCVQDYVKDETGVDFLLIILGPHYSRFHIDNYVNVDAVFIHENFPKYETKYADIQKFHAYNVALVRGKNMIEFDNSVSPACLPYKFSNIDWTSIPENDIYLRLFHNYSIPHFFNVEIVNELECSWQREVKTGMNLSDSTRQLCNYIKLKDEDNNKNSIEDVLEYEKAAMNAICKTFPDTTVKGCFYHFCRSLFKKSKLLGIKSRVQRRHVARCAGLARLPLKYIASGYEYIMKKSPKTEKVAKFNAYCNRFWFNDTQFIETWCCQGEIFYDNFASGGPIMYKESTTGLQYVIGVVTQVEFTQQTNLLLNVKLAPLLTWITNMTKKSGNDYLYCKL